MTVAHCVTCYNFLFCCLAESFVICCWV